MPRAATALLCLLLPWHAEAARVVTLADVAVGNDDNIVSARDHTPRRTEQWLQAGIATALSESLNEGLSLRLHARLDGRVQARYQGLNQLTGELDSQLLLRPGRRFYTPTLGLGMGLGVSRFASDLRDQQEARVRLTLREAITTRLSARGSVFALWRGSKSEVFDSTLKGGELALDWQATAPLLLTLGYQYRQGAVVSVGTPGPVAQANARALAADDVFAGLTAFSFDAQTHIGLLSATYALNQRLSLDSQLRYIESDTHFNSRYHRWVLQTGVIARF